jgi:caspase domain-containing protein
MGGRRLGLIIGNQGYDDPLLRTLVAPSLDVELLAGVLRDEAVGQFDEVDVVVDAPEAELRRAIARFCANRTADDTLILFFSGHGILDEDGHLYLAARDTEPRLLNATGLPADYIRAQLNRCNSRRQVLILDCCHSGAYGRGAKAALGESVGAGTALITAGYGRVVLTASDATQYAWDGENLQGTPEASVFTRYLVEGLRTGAADLDGDGLINIDELYEYVYGKVLSVSSKQTPAKFADRQQGAIFIARSAKPTVNRALLSADLLETTGDRRPWIREGAVLELGRIFLDQHQGRAATAEELLRQLAEKDDSARVRAAARHMLGKRTTDTTAVTTATTPAGTVMTTTPAGGAAQAPAVTGTGWAAVWARWDEQAFRRYRLPVRDLALAPAAMALGFALAFQAGAWMAEALPGRSAASSDTFFRQLPLIEEMGTPQLALVGGMTLGALVLAALLAWRYPTLRHREVVAAVGVWAAVWLGVLAVGPGSMGHPLMAGAVASAGGGFLAGWTLWGFVRGPDALRGAAVVGGAAFAGWVGWVTYLLASSRYFGDFYERVDAARWFVIHLVFFESTRTASWILSGAIFGLVSCLAAMALMLWVRVMLPPPHAFARRG